MYEEKCRQEQIDSEPSGDELSWAFVSDTPKKNDTVVSVISCETQLE